MTESTAKQDTIQDSPMRPSITRRLPQLLARAPAPSQVVQSHSDALKHDLRAVLRDIAQPVAVVTSMLPPGMTNNAGGKHGATLSSFTSIAMDPYPLVAFSLRIPSRMASALEHLSTKSFSERSRSGSERKAHMVVNLLSASQADLAIKFSRPDLYPDPFSSTPFSLSEDGMPILHGVTSAISCQLVSRAFPLHDLEYLAGGGGQKDHLEMPVLGAGEVASELFLARVTRVETPVPGENLGETDDLSLPLIYHRRTYTTCLHKQST